MIPHVDSLGLNDQELAFISFVGDGPFSSEFDDASMDLGNHVYKTVEILHWLLIDFGTAHPNFQLHRIHIHALNYHVIAVKGSRWLNSESALVAGARVAVARACQFPENGIR